MKNNTVDKNSVRNQMRVILGDYKNQSEFFYLYVQVEQGDVKAFLWEFFGKKKIPELRKTRKAFEKQAEELGMREMALDLFTNVYGEELQKSYKKNMRGLCKLK